MEIIAIHAFSKKKKSEHKLAQPEFELALPISFSDWVFLIEQKVDICGF